ncbi:MAG: D-alanyl-D-alanine carboxypeptidase family protein [Ruminococcus sp.]|nr:D-alanyl-D-alanine carboxypeptidase family protein [Ruminococcus sp.]
MKKIMCIISVLMLSGSLYAGSAMAENAVAGDINSDGVYDTTDLNLVSDYILGKIQFSENQYYRADINGDGRVDSFDLVGMRKELTVADAELPTGKYIGESEKGIRHYNFFEGGGNYVDNSIGTGAAFAWEISGNNVTMHIGSSDNITNAVIEWTDENHFNLIWENGTTERFSPESAELPTGKYIAESEKGVRYYNFFDGGGNYVDSSTGTGSAFAWEINGNNVTVHIGAADNTINAVIEWTDENNFTLIWEDGTMEKFSPTRVEVINGITYVDGILIVNKTYSLPSGYNPMGLTAETQKAFSEMSAAASRDGLCLCVYSGFRSYSYQQQIYNNYVSIYGQATADTFSARAGHSEHQTGMAIDVNCADDSFEGTPEALWLAENSWKYGFIIRYPKGKQHITGYKYEPWHIRYLGKETAGKVYRSGLTLEEYLGIDSVYR